MKTRAILAAIALVWVPAASPGPATPAEPALLELATRAREARLAGDRAGWLEHGRAALAKAPDHPDLLLSTARAYAANGRAVEALDLLEQAVRRGARVDAASLPEFQALAAHERFRTLAARGLANQRPIAPPEEFLLIADTSIDTEGIAYDADTARLFIGSLKGGIWQVDLRRNIAPFAGADSGLREVLGLKVDRRRRLLWVATGVFPDLFGVESKKDVGLAGVLAFNLDTGARASECWLDERPVMHGFNDFALAGDGDVYVSDSPTGSVYWLPAGTCAFERIFQDARMSYPNGMALSSDETRLYVAHIEGLSVIDLASGRRTLLTVPENAAVNSMDGLVREGEDLIGIQPSPYLARVLRIRLAAGGNAVREVVTLSAPPPPDLIQTTGVVVGSHYYSVAGAPDPQAKDRRARILRSDLR